MKYILFFNLGGQELILVLIIVLLLFGAKKIPELAKGLGKGMREFKNASKDVKSEIKKQTDEIENTTKIKNETK